MAVFLVASLFAGAFLTSIAVHDEYKSMTDSSAEEVDQDSTTAEVGTFPRVSSFAQESSTEEVDTVPPVSSFTQGNETDQAAAAASASVHLDDIDRLGPVRPGVGAKAFADLGAAMGSAVVGAGKTIVSAPVKGAKHVLNAVSLEHTIASILNSQLNGLVIDEWGDVDGDGPSPFNGEFVFSNVDISIKCVEVGTREGKVALHATGVIIQDGFTITLQKSHTTKKCVTVNGWKDWSCIYGNVTTGLKAPELLIILQDGNSLKGNAEVRQAMHTWRLDHIEYMLSDDGRAAGWIVKGLVKLIDLLKPLIVRLLMPHIQAAIEDALSENTNSPVMKALLAPLFGVAGVSSMIRHLDMHSNTEWACK